MLISCTHYTKIIKCEFMSGNDKKENNGLDKLPDIEHSEFTPIPDTGEEPPKPTKDDKALDSVEKDFNREKTVQHIKQTLWQNKRVRITMIAMGGLAMMSYFAWVFVR